MGDLRRQQRRAQSGKRHDRFGILSQRLLEVAPAIVGGDDVFGMPFIGKAAGDADSRAAILDHKLLDNFITEEELWSCTSCRACVYECPVSIDQLSIINEMRRNLVLTESRFPEEVLPAFEAMMPPPPEAGAGGAPHAA